MDVFQTLAESCVSRISSALVKYLLWRPLGKVLFNHKLAFEDMPFLQAVSMLGSTLAFTHSKLFFLLTYAYEWKRFCPKQEPVICLGIIGGTAQSAGMFMMSQKKHPHVRLLGVGSRTLERGETCIKKYLLYAKVYSPYEQLLADPTIEGVVVFCPISMHERLITKVLEAGKHCILIPPIVANANQMKCVLQYKREQHPNLLCISAYAALAHPVNHRMRDLIRCGAIGGVKQVIIRANWPSHNFHSKSIQFNYAYAGGAWEDLGPHAISLARFMLDGTQRFTVDSGTSFEVKSATATVPFFASNVDETMNTTFLYGGILVDIEVSLVKPMDTSIEIKGTDGMLRQTQWYRPDMYNMLIYHKADGTSVVTEYHGKGTECGRGPWEYMLDYIVDAFQTKGAPPLGSCDEELRTLEIVDEVYKKSGLGIRCPL